MLIDFKTTNKSFISMYKILKALGIKNNKFFLILFDDSLQGVDPFAESVLSIEMKERIKMECIRNPYYYFRELWRCSTEDGGLTRFRLDIAELAALFLQLQSFNTFKEKPRQTGKTVSDLAHIGYNYLLKSVNADIGIFNYDDTHAKLNLQRVLEQLDLLPTYLHMHKLDKVTDSKTGQIVLRSSGAGGKAVSSSTNDILQNTLHAITCGQTRASAERAGKGGTFSIHQWDELSSVPYVSVALGAGFPAQNTAAKHASKAGLPNYIALTTTPPDMSTRQGMELYQMVKVDMLKFEVEFFDCSTEELRSILKKSAKLDFFYITYQYYELGYDENWALTLARKLGKYVFKRDILLQWLKDYSESPFNMNDLDKIEYLTRREKYKTVILPNGYIMKIYSYKGKSPEDTLMYFKNRMLSFGFDIGSGLGGNRDHSTICGSCPLTGDTIMTVKTNELDAILFAELIEYIMETYFDKRLLVPERNSYGKAVIDVLKRKPNMEKDLYYTAMSQAQERDGQIGEKKGKYLYGVFNIESIRIQLYNVILVDMVKKKKRIIKSNDIYEEISTLVEKNGRIDHKSGCHDDLLIAKLFSLWPLLYDDELRYNFGIEKLIMEDDDVFGFDIDNFSVKTVDYEKNVMQKADQDVITFDDLADLLGVDKAIRQSDHKTPESETILDKIKVLNEIKNKGTGMTSGRYGEVYHNYDDDGFDPYK